MRATRRIDARINLRDKSKIWLPQDWSIEDVVLKATITPRAKVHITLEIRKRNGGRDTALLILPAAALKKTLAAVNANRGITLRELGDLII